MSLLETRGLRKDFGGLPLFEDVAMAMESGHKYGIVGRNGCGKTTLIRILAGLDDDFSGRILKAPGLRLGYVPQKPPDFLDDETGAQYICRDALSMRAELERLGEAMADPEHADRAMEAYAALRDDYDAIDGDQAEDMAVRLLGRIGLGGREHTPALSLSGGEKNVLALARAMMGRPDLLLLDEPGNHLDVAGLAWLEDYLAGLPCAVLMVSHDRRLLDRVVDSVFEIENRCVTRWSGNYSAYRLARLRESAGQGQRWQADRKKLERLEALVKKFEQIARARPDPAWGRRLRARRSQLARERENAEQRPDLGTQDARVSFQGEASKADLAVDVRSYAKAYGDTVILKDSGFTILNGERVALVGPNGSGKTSFIRDLVERGSWDDDTLRVGPSMRLGYCAQDQGVFDPALSVEDAFLKWLPTRADVFKHLSTFLFGWDDLDKACGSLSGGELNRLQLARASAQRANFLVLDEPTNHLDIPTREAVEDALDAFEGTVLVVSHDRYFLEKVAGRVVFIEDKRFVEYEGSFSEWWRDVGAVARPKLAQAAELDGRARARKAGTGGAGSWADKDADYDRRIGELERRRSDLERKAALAIEHGRFADAKRLAAELDDCARGLDELWKRWGAAD